MNKKEYYYSYYQYLRYHKKCDALKKYKGLHKGQRCFIIGTGPSLTVEDLERLKGEITIGSNRIFEIFPKTTWRPTYYISQDRLMIKKFEEDIKALECQQLFLPLNLWRRFQDKADISFFILRHKNFYPGDAEFSTHVNRYIGQGFTVTYGAIQLAFYMGFKEVYLVGIDHNYSISLDEKGVPVLKNDVKDYFEGSKASNKGLNLPRIVESTMAYMTARKFADKHPDFNIYNATRGGKLEAFERVNLDEILNR